MGDSYPHIGNASQAPVIRRSLSRPEHRPATLGIGDAKLNPRLLHRPGDGVSIRHVGRQAFFREDMFARLGRGHDHVPMGGRARIDHHSVQVLGDEGAEIREKGDAQLGCRFLAPHRVFIVHRGDGHIVPLLQQFRVSPGVHVPISCHTDPNHMQSLPFLPLISFLGGKFKGQALATFPRGLHYAILFLY